MGTHTGNSAPRRQPEFVLDGAPGQPQGGLGTERTTRFFVDPAGTLALTIAEQWQPLAVVAVRARHGYLSPGQDRNRALAGQPGARGASETQQPGPLSGIGVGRFEFGQEFAALGNLLGMSLTL